MKRKILTLSPSPYPSPQGEGTSGNPTASGWGIKNIINCFYVNLPEVKHMSKSRDTKKVDKKKPKKTAKEKKQAKREKKNK
jgi:hypothetical protein